ncbi:uncharacterized protein LOC18099599 [Populus trichocarpa]|uniref:uncharacterized protein LOC18099599 n=1 Tax=Populus trichocarpa TaxID=3694 RepID=UPI002277580A|nr:uncharacterized protein LOC18099599 [Populus trichocarpa]
MGPFQPKLAEYPRTESGRQYRRFQYTWFDQFPWLEYSPSKDAIFCFPCFIFENKVSRHLTFTTEGFRSWKRVNDGVRCALLMYVGSPTSPHNNAVKSAEDLMKVSRHIDKVLNAQTVEEVQKTSNNRGNFLEMIRLMGRLNVDIDDVVLEKAPKNAKYTSPTIQKEILHILVNKVRKKICEEVRDAKFCILVDEAKDASNKEQMAIVLRFVDIQGFVRERFFSIVHVSDTTSSTLKKEICDVLARYNLYIFNMRGQGYDGASNMRGAWNGLQALFLRDYPYAYYVHCFAHRLQLALVAAAGNEISIWLFFSKLTTIINLICASPKRHTELHYAQAIEIAHMVATGECETGRGANQIGNLHQSGTTRWSSHFDSICSLIDMYDATILCLKVWFKKDLLILYVEKLQKSLDILNAMDLVSTTKALLQTLRDARFDLLLANVQFVCTKYEIDIPHMNASYKKATDRSCQQQVDAIYKLAEKFYLEDFNEQEMYYLRYQLEHYQIDVIHHESFQNMSTISELCRGLAETNKSQHYHLIDRLIRLVLTLHVSTATTERAFSAMKHVKTVLCNKIEEEFLADSMMIYIERELVEDIDSDSIIDEFYTTKHRRVQL